MVGSPAGIRVDDRRRYFRIVRVKDNRLGIDWILLQSDSPFGDGLDE